ncbi:MAG: HAMP domain-containing sensor histidine kinase [Candidatus Omnitrophica bacterium]|nr:HAMP domain-containing sensor histidine kinase [Candidatus Omnitrophota bacterium]
MLKNDYLLDNSRRGVLRIIKEIIIILFLSLLVFIIGFVDYRTDPYLSFLIFYLIPIFLAVWFLNLIAGGVILIESFAMWLFDDIKSSASYTHPIVPYWDLILKFSFCCVFIYILITIKKFLKEIKRQKEELEDSYKKLKELETLKDALTHMIIHDLSNPLAVISGALQLFELKSGANFKEGQKNDFQAAFLSIQDLQRLISDLLDINKLEEGRIKLNIETFLLQDVARQVFEQMKTVAFGADKNLSFEVPAGLPPVSADKDIIRRVIVNLINNSLKFTPSKGSVVLSIFQKPEENSIYIRVKDTGRGIPKEYLNRIFDKFVQVEEQKIRTGHGLGLTFCKMMVEAHGGSIYAESEGPGKGSTFTTKLPV